MIEGHPDLDMLMIVAEGLGAELREKVVFVGGATTSLYLDDPATPKSMSTLDVDCIIEISGLASFESLEKKLWKLGFKQPVDEESPPICRWDYKGISVDVMPTSSKTLGFTNLWYKEGIINRESIKLPNGRVIFILSLPYFVATKLEALKDRGGSDIRMSHDLDDIALVLSGNTKVEEKLKGSSARLKKYLRKELAALVKNPLFPEALNGFLGYRGEEKDRGDKLYQWLKNFSKQLR